MSDQAGETGKRDPVGCVSWAGKLIVREDGLAYENIPNVLTILNMDPRWIGVFRFNRMEKRVYVHRECPDWDVGAPITPRPLEDLDEERCRGWLQKHGTLWTVSQQTVSAGIMQTAHALPYHPVQDEIKAMKWDGEKRIEGWLIRYFGTDDTPYTRAIGSMFMVSMIRRIFEPGCKMDYMLVLEGAQGLGKSTACKILAGEQAYMEGHFKELGSVDTSISIRNKWIIEFGEMHSVRKAEINELKMWLTRQAEDYRPRYGRHNVVEPRQCVFIGTSNNSEYLKDETGGRRFWPVLCSKVELDNLKADRDQLIAEAYQMYLEKSPHYPTPAFEREHFQKEQEARRVVDPWDVFLAPLAQSGIGTVTYDHCLQKLNLSRDRLDTLSSNRISNIMKQYGREKVRMTKGMVFKKIDRSADE